MDGHARATVLGSLAATVPRGSLEQPYVTDVWVTRRV
jgi:hypothetical protein